MPLPINESAPVERKLLRDVVYNRIYMSILDGTLEPGETLVDDTLTSWLGVSRTPIREALMKLADIGLVELAPNRYTRVSIVDHRALGEAVSAYVILSKHAARTTTAQLTPEARENLSAQVERITHAAASGDRIVLGEALDIVLSAFTKASRNEALIEITASLSPQMIRYVTTVAEAFGGSPAIADACTKIIHAAQSGDADGAVTHIGALLTPVHEALLEIKRRSDSEIDEKPLI